MGFKTPPGGNIGSPNHVLNDHSYCCAMNPGECANGEPKPEDAKKCLDYHTKKIQKRVDDSNKLKLPLFISEFGACLDSSECVTEINQVAGVCEKYNIGWAYWQFKTYEDLTTSAGNKSEGFYNNDGTLQKQKVKALSRTYVKNAAGTLKSSNFVADGGQAPIGEFNAQIEVDTSLLVPTVIHVATQGDPDTIWYPNGYTLSV